MPVGFQAGLRLVDWVLSGASVDLDFTNNRFFGSSGGSLSSYLSISRASIGNAKNSSGVWVQFPSNTLRVTDLGLLIEDARTNYLLQSETPATQTTASLATGSYTLWVEGSGSALASGGSATITGAASVTAGSPDTFTVTVAGTVVVTVTGSLTRFQLENGAFATSYIPTTTTSATRAADSVSIIGPLDTLLRGTNASVVVNTGAAGLAASSGYLNGKRLIGSSPDTGSILFNNTDSTVTSQTSGVINLQATAPGGVLFSLGAKTGGAWSGAGRSVVFGGGTVATDANTGFSATTYFLGYAAANVAYWFGYFNRLTAWNSRLPDATLQALTI